MMSFEGKLQIASWSVSPILRKMIEEKIKQEEDILRIMTIFPAQQYRSNPTVEQIGQLVERAADKLPAYDLYAIFSSGIIPSELDALIKELAVSWNLGEYAALGGVSAEQIVNAVQDLELGPNRTVESMMMALSHLKDESV